MNWVMLDIRVRRNRMEELCLVGVHHVSTPCKKSIRLFLFVGSEAAFHEVGEAVCMTWTGAQSLQWTLQGLCSSCELYRVSVCYKETLWLGMHKQAGTRAGNPGVCTTHPQLVARKLVTRFMVSH